VINDVPLRATASQARQRSTVPTDFVPNVPGDDGDDGDDGVHEVA
jgi:hypothetical protein